MIDSHCHLYFPEFNQDMIEVVERARKTGVSFFVQVGASLEDSRKAIALADKYDDMIASAGIHPHDAENIDISAEIAELKKLAQNEKVKAIGECGLDFGKAGEIGDEEKKAQIVLFKAQIVLAKDLKLPLIIHCRNAHKEIVQILQTTYYSLPTIIHCFTGSWDDAKRYLDLGCFISFSGIVTFQKKVEGIREAAMKTPLDRLLVETNAPYLAPEPNRGKRNESVFIKNIIQSIADLRGVSFDDIEKVTDQNARKIFG